MANDFTAGPWHILPSEFAEQQHNSVEINDASGLTVAFSRKFVSRYADEGAANARLIAAAPELFEALDYLLSAAQAVNDDNHCVVDPDSVRVASAALAKARGDAA